MAKLKISRNWKIEIIKINDQSPILDQLENSKIEIASSCRNGTCGVCACKILDWADKLDQERFWPNIMDFPDFLTCIWWISSWAAEDDEITLEPLF